MAGQSHLQLSVVLPTYNERENVVLLITKILDVLRATPCEVIVVDDGSPDGTASTVRTMAGENPRLRLIERPGKSGLSGAVFAGAESARSGLVAVMDADMSHDPQELPDMLAKVAEGYDLVIGSRAVKGSAFLDQPLIRRGISLVLNVFARTLLFLPQRDVLSGYALCRRHVITEMPTRYSAQGFKWLLEVLATQPTLRVCEWPVVFHDRNAGTSKANAKEAAALATLCLRLFVWRLRRAIRAS